jgi:DNA-binding winged helix-turn-helix (wHTH) protein/tetratricopeptide (TPR) repeat protein
MNRGVFYFGDCSINIASRELLLHGERVNLSPIVFDCIAYLIQHRDRAVGRDELVAAVWGKASVSDAMMGKTILTARRAIGDNAEEQRMLRTVPRFGYQWNAQTRAAEESPQETPNGGPAESAPADVSAVGAQMQLPAPSRRRIGMGALIVAGLILLIALAIGFDQWRRTTPTQATIASVSTDDMPANLVVVLPVEVMASAEDEWLRLGLMDLIATRLRNAGVSVLSSDNVVRLVPAGMGREAAIAALRGVAERSRLVLPVARRSGTDWVVRAELRESDGSEHAIEVQTDNVITAASGAADRLLDLLGKRSPREIMNAARLSQTELLQRIDAARLAGDAEQARALIVAADQDLQRAPEVQLRLAQIDLRTGQFEAARARLDELVRQVTAENDPLLHARLQSYLCIALARVGKMDAAIHACDQAIALLETRERPDELGRVYSDRGIIHTLQGQYELSGKDFARARIALNQAGDALLLAKVEGNESNLDMAQGRYADAVQIQKRIGQRFERFGMHNEQVASLNNQTDAHLALLQPLDALTSSDQALALLGHVSDVSIRYLTKLERANALEVNGRLGEARILLDEVIQEIGSDDQYAPERAVARASQARLDLITGQPAAALLLGRQALHSLPTPPYARPRVGAWLSVLRSLHALGRVDEGAAEVQSLVAWARTVNDPVVVVYARIAAAEQAVAEHRAAAAGPAYEDALAAAKNWGVADTLTETVDSYGNFLLAQDDLAQASSVIGLVARYADVAFDSAVLQARLYRALGREQAAQMAIAQARRLAGERPLPADLSTELR